MMMKLKLNIGCPHKCKGYTCVDLHPRGEDVVQADAIEYLEKLPPESCTEIKAFNLLEHLAEPFRFLKASYKVLASEGKLILRLDTPFWLPYYIPFINRLGIGAYATNNYKYTFSKADNTNHYYLWSELTIRNLLKAAGFKPPFHVHYVWYTLMARYVIIARR